MIKQVKSHPDYWVTDSGIVYSKKKYKTKQLSPGFASGGYLQVWLSKDGVKTGIRVNRLVLTVFVGDPPSPKHEAAHIDGNKLNNCLSNLQWKTKLANAVDRDAHGTTARGASVGTSRWTVTEIKEMRRLSKEGLNNEEIAKMFDTHRATVHRIVNHKAWGHV